MKIGDKIRELRNEFGMTQKELAAKLGVKPSTVGMYEQGRRGPDNDMIVKLCGVFGVSSDSLLGVGRESDEITDVVKNMTENIRHDESIVRDGTQLTKAQREDVIEAIELAVRLALLKKGDGNKPTDSED